MTALITVEKLSRTYGPVRGVSELSFAIERGVTGLIGPNGAGKSTFLKLVAGEIKPSSGTIDVLGLAPFANREFFRRVGFCPQQDALYDDLNAVQMVAFLMRLAGFGASEAERRANLALDRVGLANGRERRTSTYSKGMRQRVKLAQAIAHEPEFVIVDEPLNGLDPVGRAEMGELFAELGRHGTSILISSHVLHEVESLTNSIVLLHRGGLLAQGTVGDVRKLLNRHPRRVEIELRDARRIAGRVMEFEHVTSVRVGDVNRLSIETSDLERFFGEFTALAAAERAGVQSLESPDASLEAVFDYLVQ